MGVFDRISKALEKGRLEARQEASDRQAAREVRRDAFNKAMDHYDAKEDRHTYLADQALRRGDTGGYQDHQQKADAARKARNAYPDPH